MRRGVGILFVVAVLPGLLWYASQRGPGGRENGLVPLRDHGHPILLVVDAERIAESGPRGVADRWFDLEWMNILTQGYGGCDVASTSDAHARLAGRQLVVIPRRTAAVLDADLLEAIDARVRGGLEVLVEAPDTSLCERFGLQLAAIERRPKLPWPRPVSAETRPQLALRPQPVPVPWTRFRYAPLPTPASERPRVHLSLDGRPMGWTRAHGEGAWLVLGVDFAELSSRLRQGEQGRALLAGPDDAWLDAWIEGLCGSALTSLPLARIATTPARADGWLVIRTPADSLFARDAPGQAGWDFGTGVPAPMLLRDGTVATGLRVPPLYRGLAESLDLARLDRWVRRNREGAASAASLEFESGPDPALVGEIGELAGRRGHLAASTGSLQEWWTLRGGVRVFVESGDDTIDYRIEALPETTDGFGLLVPLRWRDRSLEGWDADWGFAGGRRVQRFDRSYRLIELGSASVGGRLSLRYR